MNADIVPRLAVFGMIVLFAGCVGDDTAGDGPLGQVPDGLGSGALTLSPCEAASDDSDCSDGDNLAAAFAVARVVHLGAGRFYPDRGFQLEDVRLIGADDGDTIIDVSDFFPPPSQSCDTEEQACPDGFHCSWGQCLEMQTTCDGDEIGLLRKEILFTVSGHVTVENITFEGLHAAIGPYIVSTDTPCEGNGQHAISIRGCSFDGGWSPTFAQQVPLIQLGNIRACQRDCSTSVWQVRLEENVFENSVFGALITNARGDAANAVTHVWAIGNTFRYPMVTPLFAIASAAGSNGTILGHSEGNLFESAFGGAIDLIGGCDLFNGPGGANGTIRWTSREDTFFGNNLAYGIWGGHRHDDWYDDEGNPLTYPDGTPIRVLGPSYGNAVYATIQSPVIAAPPPNYWWNFRLRDVELYGSSTYEAGPLGELYAANQVGVNESGEPILLPGNTAEVMLIHSESEVGPLFFDVRHHMDNLDGRRDDPAIPDVVGCETGESPDTCLDGYGNSAQLRSSKHAFERLNPDVDPVPHDVYFRGH